MSRKGQSCKWFSYAHLTWEIRRFRLITLTQIMMSAPKIKLLGPVDTEWIISLQVLENKDSVLLRLEMEPNETLQRSIQVHWACCVLNEKNEGLFLGERIYMFGQKSNIVVEMLPLEAILNMLGLKRLDTLILRCRMLVRCDQAREFPHSRVDGIAGLSNDLNFLPTSFLYHDVTTTVNNFSFSLHKAMLYQRSAKIAEAIEQSTSKMMINFDFYDANATATVLKYIYTGDLRFLLLDPNVVIPDHIEALAIPELKHIYSKQIIHLVSDVQYVGSGCKWTITSFRDVNKVLYGPQFEVRGLKCSFRLFMTVTESEKKEKSLCVEAVLLESKRPLSLTVDFECMNEEYTILVFRKFSKVMTVKDTVGGELINTSDIKASGKPELENFFKRKILVINLEFRIRAGDIVSDIVEDIPPGQPDITPEKSFGRLVKIMNNIFKSHDYSDFHFLINDVEIKAHKFLVAARSPIFKELLRRHEDMIYVKISDIQIDVFREFLSYMYMGLIRETDAIKLIELYNLGEQYKVNFLQAITLNLIMNLINEKNMLRVLMFATDKELLQLKDKALKYVVSKFSLVEDHPDSLRLKSTRFYLYREMAKLAAPK